MKLMTTITSERRSFSIVKMFFSLVLLGLSVLCGGCTIILGPQQVLLRESTKSPIIRMDRINEARTGVWTGGGFSTYLRNTLNKPPASGMFTQDGSGLPVQFDLVTHHDDDGPRLVELGMMSMCTLGLIPLHYRSEWPVSCKASVRTADGALIRQYSAQATGIYEIWTYPLTMFSLFGASFRGDADGCEIMRRTADDIVAQIMRAVESDYQQLATFNRTPTPAMIATAVPQTAFSSKATAPSGLTELATSLAKTGSSGAVAATGVGESWALLIGAQKYQQLGPLKYSAADARSLKDVLVKHVAYHDKHVIVLADDGIEDADKPTVGNIRRRIAQIAETAEVGDTVVIFFSGHGLVVNGENVLVPTDGDADNAVSTSWIKEKLRASKAGRKVLILDVCHAGAGTKGVSGIAPSLENDAQGLVMLLSSNGEQLSSEDPVAGHSVFTRFLLEGLAGAAAGTDRKITAGSLFQFVQKRMKEWSFQNGRPQTPVIVGQDPGRFILGVVPEEPRKP